MAGLSKQKQKLLLLRELLERETDDKHSLTVAQIISKLEGMGIKAERKTVYDDIATLQDFGLDVTCQKDGHSNAYAVSSRDFELEELFVLVDAVSSCRFLTIKKSNELIDKIKGLTSKYLSEGLKRSIYIENRPRSSNETVYYNINFIHSAINERKKICFKYFTYNDKKIETEVPQQIIEGRFMLPLRAIESVEFVGIKWDGETKTASITHPFSVVPITVEEADKMLSGDATDINLD